MAAGDSQNQLFNLIRDFAAEKSQGEKRVINSKKRIEELQSLVDDTSNELENTKRFKETTEQELKGYEVELSMCEASIQTLETRLGSIQEEISKVGSDVDSLKNKEAALRDKFISTMQAFNSEIRQYQDYSKFQQRQESRISPDSAECDHGGSEDAEVSDHGKKISISVTQIAAEEEGCRKEHMLHNQLNQELANSRRRLELIKTIMRDIKEIQELTRLTAELEEKCASSSEELQQMCLCPACHLDNSESLAELLQEMDHA